ncbi:E3 ubiquitin-protein ligase SIAH1B-like [Centruroides sculpturatus]|uniref:E3 ubiquitin-protein ligase SIAH1B-like n=1 Tax=Centruroides sculpturatus TaxID=218467 RepID=UPI000C6E9F37|nr:E3 ubiquitin-protein ligase SIAH1B-like [Centruroides sculpturatus]
MEAALISLLNCPICYTRVRPPVYQCTNGHIVCADCRPRITNCHTCREPLGHIRSLIAEQIAGTIQAPCEFQPFGCPELLQEDNRRTHEESCNFRPLLCPFRSANCLWEGAHSFLRQHINASHPQVPTIQKDIIFFGGIDFQITRGTWAAILECYSQSFLLLISSQLPDHPIFTIHLYFLDKPSSLIQFRYNIKFKKGDHILRWGSIVSEIYGEHPNPSSHPVPWMAEDQEWQSFTPSPSPPLTTTTTTPTTTTREVNVDAVQAAIRFAQAQPQTFQSVPITLILPINYSCPPHLEQALQAANLPSLTWTNIQPHASRTPVLSPPTGSRPPRE